MEAVKTLPTSIMKKREHLDSKGVSLPDCLDNRRDLDRGDLPKPNPNPNPSPNPYPKPRPNPKPRPKRPGGGALKVGGRS
eukprot:1156557-Pelagomonas_calceolata.AAC.1